MDGKSSKWSPFDGWKKIFVRSVFSIHKIYEKKKDSKDDFETKVKGRVSST